jgi:peptide/nickel transport system substrate-binding protein
MPREKLEQLTGYGLDVSRNHEEARALMRSLGYGPDGRLKVNVSVRKHRMVSRSGGHPDGSAE